ncbi:hypothetical protein AAE478_003521 [Parahypoxylon ruwenzoriense]
MSGDYSENPPSSSGSYRTADEIVRSILDGNVSRSDVSPSGELYRAIERYYPYTRPSSHLRSDIILNHLRRLGSRSAPRNTMPLEPNPEAQRRFSREPQSSDASPLYNLPPSAPYLPPLRSLNTRRPSNMPLPSVSGGRHARARPTDRHSARLRGAHEILDENNEEAPDVWEQLQPVDRGSHGIRRSATAQIAGSQSPLDDELLEASNSRLRALLGITNSPSRSYSDLSFSSPPPVQQDPVEENRRVKRRKLDSDRLSSGFQGFRYGKYGQVEPGQLTMELVSCDGGIYSDDGQKYAAENILKNDQTEGMVFVSMTSDDLLTRTAQYQIQYSPSRAQSRRAEWETQPLTPIISIRHNDDGTMMTHAQIRARRLYNIGMDDEDNNARVAQIPTEFNVSPPPFRVTTECSDDEGDEAIHGDWRPPNRIGSLPFESGSSDDEDNPDEYAFSGVIHRTRRRQHRSSAALAEAEEAASQEAVRGGIGGGGLMAPHARFFIERNKSKCTIRFDPPVSGRFILLKMWSPHRDPGANIDIQAVIAKGFAGPRYFPSVELR